MRITGKRIAAGIVVAGQSALSAFLVAPILLLALDTRAQEQPAPELAPVSPAFLVYQEEAQAGLLETGQWGEFGFGFIPSPMDFSHLKTREILNPAVALSFPASYDLRSYGKVTAVRNQGNCGSCWAFGCMASLESFLLNGETRDFSENNLKDKAGFDYTCCAGGNADMSAAYFTRWDGPANEASDPYNASSCTSPASVPVQKHVQEVIYIPGRSGDLDNDGIKQAVITYGAVTISMNWVGDQWNKSSYWNPSPNWAYYYNGSLTTNHMVAVVGWDDNFAASKFSTAPPGNGAFLIRNSWGTSWGNAGYFWISYYDTCTARYDSAVFTGEPPAYFGAVYQYDPLGQTSALGYGAGVPAWCANMFTASASQSLVAASTYFLANNTAYELYVYTGCTASAPRSGTLVATKSGVIANAGYHTIELDTPVALTNGQMFSIVFKLTTPGYSWPIPMEYPFSGYSSAATASAGQSFYGSNGTSWTDLTSSYANTNACIKAFTASGAPGEIAPGITGVDIQLWSADKTTQSWPADAAATGYRLYRGTQADFPNILNGNNEGCRFADQTGTSKVLSADNPASGTFYWYIVTGYNAIGEGSAGNGTAGRRYLSASACP